MCDIKDYRTGGGGDDDANKTTPTSTLASCGESPAWSHRVRVVHSVLLLPVLSIAGEFNKMPIVRV